MKVKQLKLTNYGRFEDLTVDFAPTEDRTGNVTVIIGNNGAGKSQILEALACQFEGFLKVFRKNNSHIVDLNKKLNTDTVKVYTDIEEQKKQWHFYREENNIEGFSTENFSEWQLLYKKLNESNNFPIICFYSDARLSNDLQNNSTKNLFDDITYERLNAYDNCLNPMTDFSEFLDWFKFREDIENEEKRKVFDDISNKLIENAEDTQFLATQFSEIANKKDKQLTACKTAITTFISYFSNLYIDRKSKPFNMIVKKGEEELKLNQLSKGEKSLLALVGDIARRLAILNPSLDNPLEGEGVVMIDEVDLHLHPQWQQDLIDKLVTTFPNVQFIVTTHSPHIISDRADILVYALDDGQLTEMPNVYGEDVNTVLTKVFDVDIRDKEVQQEFDDIAELIANHEFEKAEKNIIRLEKEIPHNLELLRCRFHLTKTKARID